MLNAMIYYNLHNRVWVTKIYDIEGLNSCKCIYYIGVPI